MAQQIVKIASDTFALRNLGQALDLGLFAS